MRHLGQHQNANGSTSPLSPDQAQQLAIVLNELAPSDSASSYSISIPETPSRPFSCSETDDEQPERNVKNVTERLKATRKWSDEVVKARTVDYSSNERHGPHPSSRSVLRRD